MHALHSVSNTLACYVHTSYVYLLNSCILLYITSYVSLCIMYLYMFIGYVVFRTYDYDHTPAYVYVHIHTYTYTYITP